MSISVKNISKLYGEQKALENISFEIKLGEIVGFLGPNGAGKSTMMKILTCFIPQSEGSATVCGFDVVEDAMEVRKNVGYLPEHNPLYLEMYVKEYLYFIAGLHHLKHPKEKVELMIEKVGLTKEQNKKIGALSKGYRQRVGLAQAMIHDPQVLILDEPTTGLDPNQIVEIRNLIKEIGKEKTVMLSTHIMQEVEAICDSVIIIDKGVMVANDSTEHIKNNNKQTHIYTVEFSTVPDVAIFSAIKDISSIELKGEVYHLVCGTGVDIRPKLFKLAVEKNLEVLTLQREEMSMENIFKELTAK